MRKRLILPIVGILSLLLCIGCQKQEVKQPSTQESTTIEETQTEQTTEISTEESSSNEGLAEETYAIELIREEEVIIYTEAPMEEPTYIIYEEPDPYYEEEVCYEESVVEEQQAEYYEEYTESEYTDYSGDNPYGFTDEEIWELARIAWLENGVTERYYATYLTACTTINIYLDEGYSSLIDCIYKPGRYATAYMYHDWDGSELSISDMTWEAVYDAIYNTDRNPHWQCNGSWLDEYNLELYYADPVTDERFYY